MVDDFAYLNARIRVRRSEFIAERVFQEALNLSFPALVKVLAESTYGPDLTGESLTDVDKAVSAHFRRRVADLLLLVSGKAREAITLLLMRVDLFNVRTILRGKALGWSADEIRAQMVAGTLPSRLYDIMAEAPDAASLAQLLSLANPLLAAALREVSRADHEVLETEVHIDRLFYKAALDRCRDLDQPYLTGFIRFEIDALNLATALKLFTIGFEGEPHPFFLEGGIAVRLLLFRRLAKGEFAALQELSDSVFRRVVEAKDLPSLEWSLRCILLAKAKESAVDVLGAGLAIDYIERKEWEGARIRLLARRAYFNLSPALVEKEVFCQ